MSKKTGMNGYTFKKKKSYKKKRPAPVKWWIMLTKGQKYCGNVFTLYQVLFG